VRANLLFFPEAETVLQLVMIFVAEVVGCAVVDIVEAEAVEAGADVEHMLQTINLDPRTVSIA